MKILVDNAMPYWDEFFPSLGTVLSYNAGDLAVERLTLPQTDQHHGELLAYLPDVECLLVRSTTKVSNALLDKMPSLRFVATATAGIDHLDISALEARGISWYGAGGCNAEAVAQYVVCAVLQLAHEDNFLLANKVVAIVGNGNVGSRVARSLEALGALVIIYDPPQQAGFSPVIHAVTTSDIAAQSSTNEPIEYASFEQVLCADIICLHCPLDSHKNFRSHHLFDHKVLARLTNKQYLINAGRGELIDNNALLRHFQDGLAAGNLGPNVVLDVWENEPYSMPELIPFLRVATPHIAGHTLEGKAKGTLMLYQQLCRLYERKECVDLEALMPLYQTRLPAAILDNLMSERPYTQAQQQSVVEEICHLVYDIQNDDRVFRLHMAQFTSFAKLRQKYPIRREFSALKLKVSHTKINELLHGIGFIISNDSKTS